MRDGENRTQISVSMRFRRIVDQFTIRCEKLVKKEVRPNGKLTIFIRSAFLLLLQRGEIRGSDEAGDGASLNSAGFEHS